MFSFKRMFILLATLLIVIALLLGLLSVDERGILFYVAEATVAVTLVGLYYFYQKVVKPIYILTGGLDLLREQDFGSRLKPVGQRETDQIIDTFNRMLEQLKNERLRVREQNHFLDLLISVSPMGVVLQDFDSHITDMNPAALRFMGLTSVEEIKGKQFKEIETPLSVEIAAIPRGETRTVRLNDSMVYRLSHLSFVDRGFPHPFILIESLTDEVMKAEKKAYEKVIRMIAHEVNNSVAGITSTLDSVSQALAEMNDTAELCEVMAVCVERCYSMSNFITRFADVVKIPEPQLQEVDLNTLVRNNLCILEGLCLPQGIRLSLQLCPEPLPMEIDTPLFAQVLQNIIKNAVESIGHDEGEIVLTTASSPCTAIEIADNGRGISRETEQKLFTPFFSTKPDGQGIGLIFTREVLLKHGCTFSLRTWSDGLTRFRIEWK